MKLHVLSFELGINDSIECAIHAKLFELILRWQILELNPAVTLTLQVLNFALVLPFILRCDLTQFKVLSLQSAKARLMVFRLCAFHKFISVKLLGIRLAIFKSINRKVLI